MNYQFSDNVPMPVKPGRASMIRAMGVGQSFAVPDTEITKFRAAISIVKQTTGRQFATRKLDTGGYGIWRTA